MKVTIIISCYNRAKFISRAIRSALNQKEIIRDQYEVVVVDDNSKDRSKNIIRDFEGMIIPIFNKKNLGLSSSRNKAIKKAKGEYIYILDSDDYISEHTLFLLCSFLDSNRHWGAVASDYTTVKKNKREIKRFNFKKKTIACGILYRKKTLINVGMYNSRLRINEDIDLRKRYEKKYKIGHVEIPLYRYTMHSENMTKKIK